MDCPASRPGVHPAVWCVLILPFGALSGFVGVGLTFLATKSGLSIAEGALLNGAQLLSQWLKWLWAPLVDITLTPRRWHVIATAATAAGALLMSAIPLGPATLGWLLAVIAATSLVNSLVAMAVEACITATVEHEDIGRTGAWMQAGNLGGAGLGGGLGLLLLEGLPAPWMAGAVVGVAMLACCGALAFVPPLKAHRRAGEPQALGAAVRWVVADLMDTLRSPGGRLAAVLLVLPLCTGAASGVLSQAAVAAHWQAGAREVALMQGTLAGVINAAGCFVGGWLCRHLHPRSAYAAIGLTLALIASAMALAPATPATYLVGSALYNFAVGIAYAIYAAVVLDAIGRGAGATKFSTMASLSNFPIWWLGLLLGWVADHQGPAAMLHTEAALGVAALVVFTLFTRAVQRRQAAMPAA